MRSHSYASRRIAITVMVMLLVVIVVVIAVAIAKQPQPVSFTASSTPTYVWPPVPQPTDDPVVLAPTIAAGFNQFSATYKLDFTCSPPCWNNFEPGRTLIRDVFGWLDSFYPSRSQRAADFNNDRTSPNNSITLTGSQSPDIVAYTDDGSPDPHLRAYRIGLRRDLPVPNSALNPEIVRWFPIALLARDDPPKVIYAAKIPGPAFTPRSDQPRYYVLFDYGNWAVEVAGFINSHSATPTVSICNEDEVSMFIWAYSSEESDAITVLKSISAYNTSERGKILFPADTTLTRLTESELQALVRVARSQPDCIEVVIPE